MTFDMQSNVRRTPSKRSGMVVVTSPESAVTFIFQSKILHGSGNGDNTAVSRRFPEGMGMEKSKISQ